MMPGLLEAPALFVLSELEFPRITVVGNRVNRGNTPGYCPNFVYIGFSRKVASGRAWWHHASSRWKGSWPAL